MNIKELKQLLNEYPDDMPVKLLKNLGIYDDVVDFTEENILVTSDTAFVNKDAPEEEWDAEDGKIELGDGTKYLLINPIEY